MLARGFFAAQGVIVASVTPGPDGYISTEQAGALCGVSKDTVVKWTRRGYIAPDGTRRKLPVAARYKGQLRLDPVEVAKAEYATAVRARRISRAVAA